MKFKIHGGNMVQPELFLKDKHVGKTVRHQDLTVIFGNMTHTYQGEWGGINVAQVKAEVDKAEIITEDNKVNFLGAAGWGIVGGLLTGGVGLLAGAILGGRGKETFCAIRFKDGSQFIVSGKPKDVVTLLR